VRKEWKNQDEAYQRVVEEGDEGDEGAESAAFQKSH